MSVAFAMVVALLLAAGFCFYLLRHEMLARAIDRDWVATPAGQIRFSGSVNRLTITPLSNWRTSGPQFISEPGVSYLIETDRERILFDVGFNRESTDPSPLEHNMRQLGLMLDSIDAVFISHLHRDHVGGEAWERQRSFAIGPQQKPLGSRRIFAPVQMRYPSSRVEVTALPIELMPGIATTGAIARQLAIGRVDEQALVLNLEGRGLVVIVGCGHQTLPKLLERIRATFGAPIYAIVGDLHYPIAQGRLSIAGIDVQRRLASGAGVLTPITTETVSDEIRALRSQVQRIVVGGHDTGDEAIELFRDVFGADFSEASVGSRVVFNAQSQ